MVISTLSFACMNAIVKQLMHVDAFQIVFFRSFGSLFFTLPFLIKYNIPIWGNKKKLLILRGIVGVTSMSFYFMATKHLSIGTAVSLRYIAPIFAAIFAVIFLKERIKHIQWLFFFIAFTGVIILKGFNASLSFYGLLLIFTSAIFSGLVYTVISKIGNQDHPVVIVNYFMVIATLVGGILALQNWTNPRGIEWVLLFALGVFGYFGQVNMTKAFQIAKTNQIAPLKYLEVVFTLIIGASFFKEVYSFWSLLGICLIIIGLVLNITYKTKI